MKEFVDKLIERLEERRNKFAPQQCIDYAEGLTDGYEGSIRIVNKLSEEYKVSEMSTGWIPVSERLPEADHYVLCQGNNSMFVACVDSFDGEWRDNHFYRRTNVKAWCELPAPYTEGE